MDGFLGRGGFRGGCERHKSSVVVSAVSEETNASGFPVSKISMPAFSVSLLKCHFCPPWLIAGFVILVLHALVVTRAILDGDMRKVLTIGILAVPFIFAADVLWFVPTIWSPILFAYRLADIERRKAKAGVGAAPSQFGHPETVLE
jgi:hypothetical protein